MGLDLAFAKKKKKWVLAILILVVLCIRFAYMG